MVVSGGAGESKAGAVCDERALSPTFNTMPTGEKLETKAKETKVTSTQNCIALPS